MALTWRDTVSTLALAVIVAVYAGFLGGSKFWLVSSAWATTAVILIIGLLGGCAVRMVGRPVAGQQSIWHRVYAVAAATIGVIALLAGLAGLLLDSAFALKLLVMTTIVLWGAATCRHAYMEPPES